MFEFVFVRPRSFNAGGNMLVLSRKRGERIMIGDDIEVIVVEIRGERVQLGFQCPKEIPVHRGEIYRRIHGEQLAAPSV
jgi:carbon storage regulator